MSAKSHHGFYKTLSLYFITLTPNLLFCLWGKLTNLVILPDSTITGIQQTMWRFYKYITFTGKYFFRLYTVLDCVVTSAGVLWRLCHLLCGTWKFEVCHQLSAWFWNSHFSAVVIFVL